MGVPVVPVRRDGMSDGNLLWHEVPTLDGMGVVGNHMHCSEHDPSNGKEAESLYLPAFGKKALFNALGILRVLAVRRIYATGNKAALRLNAFIERMNVCGLKKHAFIFPVPLAFPG